MENPVKNMEDLVPQMMDIDGINGASTFFCRIHLISFHSFARPEFINGTVERKALPWEPWEPTEMGDFTTKKSNTRRDEHVSASVIANHLICV